MACKRLIHRTLLRSAAALALIAGCADPLSAAEDVCPDIGLVPELTRLTKFKDGPGRTYDDVRYDVIIRQLSEPICREKDRRVSVAMLVNFDALRGRADPGGRVQFTYFVAIMHRVTHEIITKQEFPVAFDFPQGRGGVVIEEELEQITFPLAKEEQPIYYAILIGLQLDEEQLAYNRQRRGEQPEPPGAAAQRNQLPALPTLPTGLPGSAPPGQAPAPAQAAPKSTLPTLPQPKAN